jgi:hypothetical protein
MKTYNMELMTIVTQFMLIRTIPQVIITALLHSFDLRLSKVNFITGTKLLCTGGPLTVIIETIN